VASYGKGELRAFGRIFSMILRNQLSQGIGELVSEGVLVGRGGKPHIGLYGERSQSLICHLGQLPEMGDILDHPCGHGNEIGRGESIANLVWIDRKDSERAGRNDVRAGRSLHQPFDTVAASTFLNEPDQALILELTHMVGDGLSGELETASQAGRRVGLDKLLEEPEPNRVEHGGSLD
jgi:hypothetical protein